MRLFFAQIQLGLLSGFLHAFAVLALGLIWMLFFWDLYARGKDSDAFRFWLRVFALTAYSALALGLVTLVQSGLVLPLAIERMGNVLGPLLLGVVLVTFAIRSTTFGVMLYSRHRVTQGVFRVSLFVTAIGLSVVVMGISVLESWMRAPAGAALLDGQFRILDWFEVISNPQLPLQLVVVGLTTVLMLSSVVVSSWALQMNTAGEAGKPAGAIRLSVWIGLLCTLAVLPLWEYILSGPSGDLSNVIRLLAGETDVEPHESAFVQVGRALLIIWPLHLLALLVALSQMYAGRPQPQPTGLGRVTLLGAISGPLMCLGLWLLLYLGKGADMVVGQLLFADLVTPVQTQYLFLGLLMSSVLVVVVMYGWMRLTYQALASGVVTVHRPKAVLS